MAQDKSTALLQLQSQLATLRRQYTRTLARLGALQAESQGLEKEKIRLEQIAARMGFSLLPHAPAPGDSPGQPTGPQNLQIYANTRRKRHSGKSDLSHDQFILSLLESGPKTRAQLKAAWDADGRQYRINNHLLRMRDRKLIARKADPATGRNLYRRLPGV